MNQITSQYHCINEYENPVVLSHGIHSDLFTWQDFAQDIASAGHDAWLIEAYGGPTTEDCTYGCPNYTFNDLKTYYWPALIAGVQQYSGKDNLSYVGYDLGCTMALESLETFQNGSSNVGYYFDYDTGTYKYSNLSAHPVGTFVGVGCIGNFTGAVLQSADGSTRMPYYLQFITSNRDIYENKSSSVNTYFNGHVPSDYHTTFGYYTDDLKEGSEHFLDKVFSEGVKYVVGTFGSQLLSGVTFINTLTDSKMPSASGHPISVEVFKEINDIAFRDKTNAIGAGVDVGDLAIIQSTYDKSECWKSTPLQDRNCKMLQQTDNFLSDIDQKKVCQNVDSTNKFYVGFHNLPHFGSELGELFPKYRGLDKYPNVLYVIKTFLEKQQVEQDSAYDIISTAQSCS